MSGFDTTRSFCTPPSIRAEMARHGLHDLQPWWRPDDDRMVDPLDDPEIRGYVRAFCSAVFSMDEPIRKEP